MHAKANIFDQQYWSTGSLAFSDTLTLVENTSQSKKDGMDSLIQDEELSHNPALSFLMNQLVNKLATLGQRQNNYGHVDTQVNHSLKIDLNLKLNHVFTSISTSLCPPGEH